MNIEVGKSYAIDEQAYNLYESQRGSSSAVWDAVVEVDKVLPNCLNGNTGKREDMALVSNQQFYRYPIPTRFLRDAVTV